MRVTFFASPMKDFLNFLAVKERPLLSSHISEHLLIISLLIAISIIMT